MTACSPPQTRRRLMAWRFSTPRSDVRKAKAERPQLLNR